MIRDIIYLTTVVLITGGILVGLCFYNKGTTQELTGSLALNENINLNFEKVATKPAESSRYYVIFYVNLQNSSAKQSSLRVEPPTDPCNKIDRYNGTTYNSTAYQQCLSSKEHQDYLTESKEFYKNRDIGNLTLMTPQNQRCELNGSYRFNNKYPNIGYKLNYDSFQPNEKKVGSIVFDCPEKEGKFKIQYLKSSLDLNI